MNIEKLEFLGINDKTDLHKLSLSSNFPIFYLSEYYYDKYAELLILLQKSLHSKSDDTKKLYCNKLLKYYKLNHQNFNMFFVDFNNICRDILFNILQSSSQVKQDDFINYNGVKVIRFNGESFNKLIHTVRACHKYNPYEIIINDDFKKDKKFICTSYINQDNIVAYQSDVIVEYEVHSPFQLMNCLDGYTNFNYYIENPLEFLRTKGFETMVTSSMPYGCEIDLDNTMPLSKPNLICFDQINDFTYNVAKTNNLPIHLIDLNSYPKALVRLKDSNMKY